MGGTEIGLFVMLKIVMVCYFKVILNSQRFFFLFFYFFIFL